MSGDTAELLTLTTESAANGGSCVARHDGRVVFVRYALPGETVRARVTSQRESFWHADVVEVLDASADRIDPLCPIAGPTGAGCCDLAFAEPSAARRIKGEVVANQLHRLGGYTWAGDAEEVGTAGPTGWRTRVRLEVGTDGRAGFHRYHSAEVVTDRSCGQVPDGMVDRLPEDLLRPGDQVNVVIDDDGTRHIVATGRGKRTRVLEGEYEATQRIGARTWSVPVTAFWQAHRDAAGVYSDLVAQWAHPREGEVAWDLYGGAGVFAAVLADAVGPGGRVLSVDTSRAAARSARQTLADLPQVHVVTDSVRRALSAQSSGADIAVLDPPRTGAGREVVDLLAQAAVPRIIHIGCEAASFARDVGLYRKNGYSVDEIRVFDSFPLTHHVECVAVLSR